MAHELTPSSVSSRAATLGRKWGDRDRKFRDWYKIIKLEDKMKEENKESFVSNSPRTFYNLAKHLLTPKYIPHRFPYEELDIQAADDARIFAESIERHGWKRLERMYKKGGKQSFVDRIAAHMLTLGWYSVYAYIDERGLHAEVWNPAEVFPEYSNDPEEGILEVSHIYKLPRRAATYQMTGLGYTGLNLTQSYYNVYDYWFYDDEGIVCRASTLAGKWYNMPQQLPQFDTIPILVGPAGGLPDEGTLDPHFMQNYGEGCVAVNEGVYTNSDRLASFLQQAVRDATEPKWLELSQGGEILTPEKFKSGGIFRGDPGDSVNSLIPPPIPVELQQRLFDYEQKKQEGSFSPLLYGSIQFKLAAYTLSQMAQAAQQVLRPYHEGMMAVMAGTDNQWLTQMRRNPGIRPSGIMVPTSLPEDTEMVVEYPVSIPGDLINRITVAKMMNPEMRFSAEYIYKNLFPEVSDTISESAKSRKDLAMNSELGIMVQQIKAFRGLAAEAEVRGDSEGQQLYEAAANHGLSILQGSQNQQPSQPNMPRPSTIGGEEQIR